MNRTTRSCAFSAALLIALLGGVTTQASAKMMPAEDGPKKMLPGTPEGARQAIAHYAQELLKPAYLVPPRARARCGRYLETARRTVGKEGPGACSLHLRATKALAMCHWLAGDGKEARALVQELGTARCNEVDTGLPDALWLALRWWQPDLVQRLVSGQRARHPKRAKQLRKLDATKRALETTRAALGPAYGKTRGGLLVRGIPHGAPAGRSGMRAGDVLVSVAAKPVRRPGDIGKHLAGQTSPLTSILYYRAGTRIEASWHGTAVGKIDVTPLPERLP